MFLKLSRLVGCMSTIPWVAQIAGRAKLKTHWDEVIALLDSEIKSLDPPITRWTRFFTAQQRHDEHVGEWCNRVWLYATSCGITRFADPLIRSG